MVGGMRRRRNAYRCTTRSLSNIHSLPTHSVSTHSVITAGKPLFAGRNDAHQLGLIIEVLGTPSNTLLTESGATQTDQFFNGNLEFIGDTKGETCLAPNSYTLWDKLPRSASIHKAREEGLVSLLSSCLSWEPRERCTAVEALKCGWLNQ